MEFKIINYDQSHNSLGDLNFDIHKLLVLQIDYYLNKRWEIIML